MTDASSKTLRGIANEYIPPASIVNTDEWRGCKGPEKVNGYEHRRINHTAGVYVVGTTHTIEGFWSLVKRESAACVTRSARSIYAQYLPQSSTREAMIGVCQLTRAETS
jgi:hypothetical protein